MKLQHIAVVFVLIIVPIVLVFSQYIKTHIQSIQLQVRYDTNLTDATHDAAQAFQINTANNYYSTLQSSKMRDVEASISTFFNSLALGMEANGYDKKTLQEYTPAVLCTLYDGYYIYTKYQDGKYEKSGSNIVLNSEYTYGLKPFISYSCRYIKEPGNNFIVNYTLDNTITVIGKVNGIDNVAKTGHLIALPESSSISHIVNINNDTDKADIDAYIHNKLKLDLDYEPLEENLIIVNDDGTAEKIRVKYIVYNSQKYYEESERYLLYIQFFIQKGLYIQYFRSGII